MMEVHEMSKRFAVDTNSGEREGQGGAGTDPAALYRRAVITKIRLRQAIFRARHLACGVSQGRLEEMQAR